MGREWGRDKWGMRHSGRTQHRDGCRNGGTEASTRDEDRDRQGYGERKQCRDGTQGPEINTEVTQNEPWGQEKGTECQYREVQRERERDTPRGRVGSEPEMERGDPGGNKDTDG